MKLQTYPWKNVFRWCRYSWWRDLCDSLSSKVSCPLHGLEKMPKERWTWVSSMNNWVLCLPYVLIPIPIGWNSNGVIVPIAESALTDTDQHWKDSGFCHVWKSVQLHSCRIQRENMTSHSQIFLKKVNYQKW